MLDAIRKDAFYGWRKMRDSPGFSLAVIVCLGLGIGANTAAFSFANALFLRPLPVMDADQLIRVYTSYADGLRWGTLSYPDFRDLRDRSEISWLAAENVARLSLGVGDHNERIYASMVSASYFQVLGVEIARGRAFEQASSDISTTVLSHRLWQRRFGADPEIVGRTVNLNGRPFSVVGVAAEEFQGSNIGFSPELWLPLKAEPHLTPDSALLESRGSRSLLVMGRLREGAKIRPAELELKRIAEDLARIHPDSNTGTTVTVIPAAEGGVHPLYRSAFQSYLGLLQAVVALILLITCANVTALYLARAQTRRKEIGVRLALGSSRGRLIRQLLVESTVLALLASGVGLLLAHGVNRLVESFSPGDNLPLSFDFELDYRVLLFTLAVCVFTGVLSGLAPAVLSTRRALVSALKEDSTTIHQRSLLRSLLLVGQVALSLTLLIGAGLFLRGLRQARAMEVGFDPDRVAVGTVDVGIHGYDETRGILFYRQLVERLQALSEVSSASLALTRPLGLVGQQRPIAPDGYESPSEGGEPLVDYTIVAPRYFETLAIPLIQGRDFRPQDDGDTLPIAIVNQTLARRFWPDKSPVGESLESGSERYQVVGLVRDSKYANLGEAPKPYLYLPLAQRYSPAMHVIARTSGDPAALLPAISREVATLDKALAVFGAETLRQHLGTALLPATAGASVLSSFSFLAVLLAALGLYGTLAYNVSHRVREIGIRMSLGARRRDVLKLVLGQGMRLTLIGILLGLLAAFGLTRFLTGLLYGVHPLDPVTFVGASLLLAFSALAACYLPARRAIWINPVEALRQL